MRKLQQIVEDKTFHEVIKPWRRADLAWLIQLNLLS